MKRALRELRKKATEAARGGHGDVLVLVYFSGHGHCEGGDHFLIPTQMKRRTQAVSIGYIQTQMAQSGAKLKLLIVDACRTRDESDAVAHGDVKSTYHGRARATWANVNQSDAGADMYSIFSSSEGTPSYEVSGSGIMTKIMVPLIKQQPGLELSDLVKKLTKDVRDAHGTSEGGRMLVNAQQQAWSKKFFFTTPQECPQPKAKAGDKKTVCLKKGPAAKKKTSPKGS